MEGRVRLRRRILITAVCAVLVWMPARAKPGLPNRLSDVEFWNLSQRLSEPPGSFRSENFVSNERQFQSVIPDVIARVDPAQVYVGVGPEQNFSYIPAAKPRMAFIIDIRRGNLLEHLLYKAVFEISRNRTDFLSRLFSRVRPDTLNDRSTVTELFAAYQRAEPRQDLYEKNVKAVIDRLKHTHRFALTEDDELSIRNIYRHAFFTGGPNLDYTSGGGDGGGLAPTFEELMLEQDPHGEQRSFLASEQNYSAVRTLQLKNLIVPLVGDFAGPTAIRAVGNYAKEHGTTISVFYASNVEDYLIQDDRWSVFCENIRTLPLTASSTLIFSGSGAPDRFRPRGSGVLETHLRPMLSDTERCEADSAGVRR